MKKAWVPLIVGSAGLIAVLVTWAPAASAQAPVPDGKAAAAVASPIGQRCVITLDPRDPAKTREGHANADKYLVLENKVEGVLLQMSPDWVILKDGNYENWVPQDKILYFRISR
jgi:hypothetical protein